MAISNFTIPYPDFKLNDTIQPDEFDDNNNRIVNKVNEIITTFNALVVDVDALETASASGDATLQTNLNNAVTALQNADTAIRSEFAAADTATRNYFTGSTSGSSGSERVGSAPIVGVTGNTVWAQLSSLKSMIDAIVGGSIPDGTITYAKLAPTPVSTATASTLVVRDVNGRAQFATPSANNDAANKSYVDGRVNTNTGTITDTNNMITTGKYYLSGSTNAPVTTVSGWYVDVIESNLTAHLTQTAYHKDSDGVYTRRKISNTWTAWTKVNTYVGSTLPIVAPLVGDIWIDTST